MGYPEDSAGGLMTTEFLFMDENMTVAQAIQKIHESEEDLISFYIYVVNESQQLVGVLSLKQIILNRPQVLLKDIMNTHVLSVDLTTEQIEVAKIVEKYDFLSLPVVDASQKLVGLITVDDVIDVIREEASDDLTMRGMAGVSGLATFWEHITSRLPWFLVYMFGGLICFFTLYRGFFLGQRPVPWELICIIPMALFLVTLLSNQTATVTIDYLKASKDKFLGLSSFLKQELTLSLLMGLTISFICLIVFVLLPVQENVYYLFSFSFLVLVILTVLISTLVPIVFRRFRGEVDVTMIPMAVILSNIVTILFLASLSLV
jgi:magnesium transporter